MATSSKRSKNTEIPVLDRGGACLPCRRKKMRCDSVRPICGPCLRSFVPNDCEYRAVKSTSTADLMARIRELEDQIHLLEMTPENPAFSAAAAIHYNLHPFGSKFPTVNPVPPATYQVRRQAPSDWLFGEPPEDLRNILIGVFIRYHRAAGFNLDLIRFLHRLTLPPTDPQAPHPCLINAVLLTGCSFALATHGSYELLFLTRVRTHMGGSLALADRLFDYTVAGTLLARWYTRKGRFLEASHEAASIAQFATACKFNEIHSPLLSEYPSSIADEPRDVVGLGERVCLFWDVFSCEKMLALLRGLPTCLSNEKVTTMLPRSLVEFNDGRVFFQPYDTLSAFSKAYLDVPEAPAEATLSAIASDCTQTLTVKATALLDHASRLAYKILYRKSEPDATIWTQYAALDRTIAAFIQRLPPIPLTLDGGVGTAAYEDDKNEAAAIAFAQHHLGYTVPPSASIRTSPYVLGAHVLAHAAAMELAHAVVTYSPDAWANGVREAANVACIVKEIKDAGIDSAIFCLVDVMSWIAACEYLVAERRRKGQVRSQGVGETKRLSGAAFEYDQHIEWLLAAMELVPGAMEVYESVSNSSVSAPA